MAQYRNRKLIENTPIIGRTLHSDTVEFGKYHYANEELGFVGREAELCALNAFLNDSRQTLWWAITGQGGSGKSRLTYEFLKENERGWFGFFINDATMVTDAENFRPFCNTIVAIDYIQGREAKVAEWTSILLGRFKQTGFALRILLIERECDKGQESWYSRLHEALGKYDRALFENSSFSTVFLALGDLDDKSVSNLIGEIRESHGFPPDKWQDNRLREEYHKKFEKLKYRPLFVQLYVEAWITNKCTEPDYNSLEGVVETSLLREQGRWIEFFDGDKNVVESFIRLLIRAAAGGELSEDNISELYKEDWKNLKEYFSNLTPPGRQRKESCRNFLADLTQNFEQEGFAIKTYYPDIINEYMFAYYADENINEAVMELWKNAGTAFVVFMQRAQTDFSSNEVIAKIVSDSSEVAMAPKMLFARLSRLKKRIVKPGETPESLKENIDKEYDFWHKLPYVEDAGDGQTHEISNAVLKLVGLWGCAEQYGALICLDDMDRCLSEIIDMRGKIPDILKPKILEERMNACYTTGHTDLARRYEHARRVILDRLGENDPELADYNVLVVLQENSNRMMDCAFIGEVYKAKEILNGTYKNLDFTNESYVEVLAQMAMRYTLFLSQDGALKYESYVKTILKDCQNAFPDNVEIISCIYQSRSLLLQDHKIKLQSGFDDGRYEEQISGFKDEALQIVSEIEGLGRKIDADTWGVAASVLSALTEEENDIIRLIAKAEKILAETLSVETTKAWMICEHKLHELKHEVVSKQIVDKAFAYYLREPSSETTREQFFLLMDCST